MPNPAVVRRWREGRALCAVMGVIFDGFDADLQHGGDKSAAALAGELGGEMPVVYGRARTPSGGTHDLIALLGVGSHDNWWKASGNLGLDLKGGRSNGESRGHLIIAPTVRRSKITGELVRYTWETIPQQAPPDDDHSGKALADLIMTEVTKPKAGSDGAGSAGWTNPDVAAMIREGVPEDEVQHDWFRDLVWKLRASGLDKESVRAVWQTAVDKTRLVNPAKPWTERNFEADWAGADRKLGADEADQADRRATVQEFTEAKLGRQFAGQVLDGAYLCVTGDNGRVLGWRRWTGKVWQPAADAELLGVARGWVISQCDQALRALTEALQAEDGTAKQCKDVADGWYRCQNARKLDAIIRLARPDVLCHAAKFDQDPDLLNTDNGVINFRTRDLLDHDPALLMTKITPVGYVPGATHPDWTAALESLPEDVRGWYQIRLGQAITGHMPDDDLVIFQQGGGENGKSTIMEAVRSATGDYHCVVSQRALLADASQHPTELADFQGVRVASLEELPEERRLSVVRLKMLTTPWMSARKCGRDDVTWRATHTLLVSTNVPPIVSETDHGTWRWLALLVFPYTWLKPGQVPHGEFERAGDPGLRARMRRGRARHEAVLAWIIDGALKWYAAGQVMPPLPQRVERDTAGWRRESDLVLAYMDEELTFEPAAYIRSGDLQQDFNNWLNGRHQAQWSAQTFNSRFGGHEEIARRGVHNNGGKAMKRDGKVIKGWAGVRLRDRNEHEWTRGWTRP